MNDNHDHVNGDPAPGDGRRRRIGILLFDGVEELDAVGPWEVLSAWTRQHPEDGWDAFCLSPDGRPVRGAKTLELGAHHSIDDAPAMDVLVHPGGPGTRPMLHDRGHLDWVRRQRASVPLMTSVCTGSLVYAAAGLLGGRRATTHWASLNTLSELDPTVVTDVSSRFVDDGDLITSAGVSAGIDMALHLVARLTDVERSREVRREIQYDPLPPF
ncbi:DJ-1/PfpI family protein [Streptomyces scabiei]|uniref:DJ-1/PfpI family protein n=1 Tax=Streptomyces scabiei TaxID=1930 RepID=UPI00298F57F8|nr:DJ-1/PfpI family protein [Streptomyces scabiei]MDW8807792.1 DJ-1/PfpI family protein [Streptomyces scabiei]